jgi:hypothetical protein
MSQGRKNLYHCNKCNRIIVTIDIDEGTTPFMLSCYATKGCRGLMYSQMYQCDQRLPHTHEWYKPESLDGYDPWTVEHIEKGGLVLRTKAGEELWKHLTFRKSGKPRKRHRRRDHNAAHGDAGE